MIWVEVNKATFLLYQIKALAIIISTHPDKTAAWMSSQLENVFTILPTKNTHNVHVSLLLHSSAIVEEDKTTETESIGRVCVG